MNTLTLQITWSSSGGRPASFLMDLPLRSSSEPPPYKSYGGKRTFLLMDKSLLLRAPWAPCPLVQLRRRLGPRACIALLFRRKYASFAQKTEKAPLLDLLSNDHRLLAEARPIDYLWRIRSRAKDVAAVRPKVGAANICPATLCKRRPVAPLQNGHYCRRLSPVLFSERLAIVHAGMYKVNPATLLARSSSDSCFTNHFPGLPPTPPSVNGTFSTAQGAHLQRFQCGHRLPRRGLPRRGLPRHRFLLRRCQRTSLGSVQGRLAPSTPKCSANSS